MPFGSLANWTLYHLTRLYGGCLFLCRTQGSIECEHLKNNVTLDCEKTEEKLMHRYVLVELSKILEIDSSFDFFRSLVLIFYPIWDEITKC